MACFLAPAAEAAVVMAAAKVAKKKTGAADTAHEAERRLSFADKLKWLTNMLWGGAVLLAFEHVWHGEIVPWFPFLTAMGSPEDAAEMLREIATVGVTMALLITVVWAGMVLVTNAMEKKALQPPAGAQ